MKPGERLNWRGGDCATAGILGTKVPAAILPLPGPAGAQSLHKSDSRCRYDFLVLVPYRHWKSMFLTFVIEQYSWEVQTEGD